jgi:DNA-binding CsgD family transcriptional regulator
MLLDVIDQIDRVRHTADVIGTVARFAGKLGYHALAIGAPSRGDLFEGYFFSTWPQEWMDLYMREESMREDPIPIVASMNMMPFRWSEMIAGRCGMAMSATQLHAFDIARTHGYCEGVVVPVHGPGAYLVVASYAGTDPDTSPAAMTTLHVLTLHAHVRLASLYAADRQNSAPAPGTAALSAREIEALRCVLSGLSDEASAVRMGISARTVRFHLGNARQKLGARTRAQAVSAALTMGRLQG